MNKQTILITTLLFCLIPSTKADAKSADNSDMLTISVTKLDIKDKIFRLSYELENNLDEEVWICEKLGFYESRDAEICFSEENQLLTIRKRLDIFVPSDFVWARRPLAKYVRLCPGQKRYESLSANLPFGQHYILGPRRYDQIPKNLFYVSRLAIEIGYFVGNLPEKIHNKLLEAEKIYNDKESRPQILTIFGDALTFNYFREQLRDRDQEIVIPYTYQQFKGEKVLRTAIDGLRIPCKQRQLRNFEIRRYIWPKSDFFADLKTCTKLEVCYKPSALEYFFPFVINQNQLNHEEIKYLQSEKTFFVEDQNLVKSFAKKIIDGYPFHEITHENNTAHFDCYDNNDHLKSFTIYGSMIVETEEKTRLCYPKDSLNVGMLTPEIQKLEYRVQCAINLRNLYYRLRLYNLLLAKQQKNEPVRDIVIYPESTDWIDSLISFGYFPKSVIKVFITSKRFRKPHVCPSIGEGKSTYAMNPNCEPDSPGDMVLLFETKAGWNQHGGPELFTFDNHDPKGGCVLLNDGTVKFIRTREELQQLRWK